MTREQMIGALMEAATSVASPQMVAVAAQLQADGETIARLTEERDAAKGEADMANDAIGRVRQELQADPTIPVAAFVDDHVRNAVVMLRIERESKEAAIVLVAEHQTRIARLTEERDAALAPPPAAALWKDIFGDTYTLTTWGQSEAIHRIRLSQAMRIAQQRAPECADSIAMLIWWRALDAQTAGWLQQEAHKERDAALARVAVLEAAFEPYDADGDLIPRRRAREALKGTP